MSSPAITYFGGPIAIGKVLDTFVSAMLVAWALFIIIQTMKDLESETLKPQLVEAVEQRQLAAAWHLCRQPGPRPSHY